MKKNYFLATVVLVTTLFCGNVFASELFSTSTPIKFSNISGIKLTNSYANHIVLDGNGYVYYADDNNAWHKTRDDGSEVAIGGEPLNISFVGTPECEGTLSFNGTDMYYAIRGGDPMDGFTWQIMKRDLSGNNIPMETFNENDFRNNAMNGYLNSTYFNFCMNLGSNATVNGYQYYVDWANGAKLFKLDVNNPSGYRMDDGTFTSSKIAVPTLSNVFINVSSLTPAGTSFKFYIASKNQQQELFSSSETNGNPINFMMNQLDLMCFGNPVCSSSAQSIAVGDILTIGGQRFLVSNVNFNGNFGTAFLTNMDGSQANLDSLRGNPITKGSTNFSEIIDHSLLDGTHSISLSEPTTTLWYKVELQGDISDTTKTPTVQSVGIIDPLSRTFDEIPFAEQPSYANEELGFQISNSSDIVLAREKLTVGKELRLSGNGQIMYAKVLSVQDNGNVFFYKLDQPYEDFLNMWGLVISSEGVIQASNTPVSPSTGSVNIEKGVYVIPLDNSGTIRSFFDSNPLGTPIDTNANEKGVEYKALLSNDSVQNRIKDPSGIKYITNE